ncbi:MAG TPA: NfeD family protein [Firmicutes bacterium]|nr:NfeD family protein [Bacillota bacterium]
MPIPMAVIWLIAVVVFVVAEAATLGLTSIWFACGSLLAMVAALLDVSIWGQLLVFILGSALLLASTRKWVSKLKLGRVKTNADRIIGQQAVVIQTIDNQAAKGQVRVGGQVWTARSVEDEPILAGTQVEVVQITGVKVIVKKMEK